MSSRRSAPRTSPVSAGRGFRIARLKRLGFSGYQDYLRSPVWASVRDEFLRTRRPSGCAYCDAPNFRVGHLTYERVGGDERMTDLIAICSACENLVNILERRRVALGVRSDEFRARPLHRQLAAVLALGTTDGTIIQQRIRSAVHKVAAGRSLAADLAAIDARLDHLIAERDDALDELLTLS